MTDLALLNFPKIPFTCSYLPGKSQAHMSIFLFLTGVVVILRAAESEVVALRSVESYSLTLLMFFILAVFVRWRTTAAARSNPPILQFEDEPSPDVLSLGLHRDGILPTS